MKKCVICGELYDNCELCCPNCGSRSYIDTNMFKKEESTYCRKCSSCGAEVGKSDKFCPKCGHKLEEEVKPQEKSEKLEEIKLTNDFKSKNVQMLTFELLSFALLFLSFFSLRVAIFCVATSLSTFIYSLIIKEKTRVFSALCFIFAVISLIIKLIIMF